MDDEFIILGNFDPDVYSGDQIVAAMVLIVDQATESIDTQENGVVIVADLKRLGWRFLKLMSLLRIQALVSFMQGLYPVKFKEIHICNASSFFNIMFNVALQFLSDKMKSRVRG